MRAAINGGFKESEEHIVRFPEDVPEDFQDFLTFARTGRVPQDLTDDDYDHVTPECWRLAHLWAYAESIQACAFKDAIVDAMIERVQALGSVPTGTFKIVYANSAGPSGMRRLHVDIAMYGWRTEHLLAVQREEAYDDFFYDLAIAMHRRRDICIDDTRSPYMRDPGCRYHDHWTEEPCYQEIFAESRQKAAEARARDRDDLVKAMSGLGLTGDDTSG